MMGWIPACFARVSASRARRGGWSAPSTTGRVSAVALGLSILVGQATPAAARAGGIVTDNCQACHSGGGGVGAPVLSLTSDPATFVPGDLVNFTLTVRATSVAVGGAFITSGGIGSLKSLTGEGLQVNGQGLTHTAPKAAVNGAVTFRFAWQAPIQPGGLDIRVAALAGNGNNSPAGDSPGSGDFQWVFGCSAQTFYRDLDLDGYGAKGVGTLLGCAGDAAPAGFAALDGDCDENDERVHPGATEICNKHDDNCDGQIDEGTPPVMMWPDADGDGYYKSQSGTPKVGCGNVPGYAAQAGDCDDTDPAVHPSAVEICNLKDDNCDGNVDERVRPQCGLGWCRRQSLSCSPADCHPGPPMAETCNAFDDDCDGELDNNACPSGYTCAGEACVPIAETGGSTAGFTGGSAGAVGGRTSAGGSPGDAPDAGTAKGTPRASGCAIAVCSGRAADTERCQLYATLVCAGGLAISLMRRRGKQRRRSARHDAHPKARTRVNALANDGE